MRTVTLYRLSGLAVMVGMTIAGIASVLYSRADGVALYLDPLVPAEDLAKLSGSLIFLIGLPGLYAFQAASAGRLGLAGFVLSFAGLAILEVSTEAIFAFAGPVLAARHQTSFLLHPGLEQNLGGGFTAYFAFSYLVVVAGFLCFGIATFRAAVYPRWTGPVVAIGAVAAIIMAPLAAVPSGPFRLDRIGVLAAAFAFAWCGWHLLRHAGAEPAGAGDDRPQLGRGGRLDRDGEPGARRPGRAGAVQRQPAPVAGADPGAAPRYRAGRAGVARDGARGSGRVAGPG